MTEPRVVPFEQVHPRETWPLEPCEVCGELTRAMPDHPGFMVVLCDKHKKAAG